MTFVPRSGSIRPASISVQPTRVRTRSQGLFETRRMLWHRSMSEGSPEDPCAPRPRLIDRRFSLQSCCRCVVDASTPLGGPRPEPQSLRASSTVHPTRSPCPNIHLSTYRTTALPPVKLKVGRPIEDIHLHAHQRLGSGLMIGDAQAQAQVQITAPLELPRAKRLAQAATYVHVRRGWGWIHDPLHRSSWAVGQRSGSRA